MQDKQSRQEAGKQRQDRQERQGAGGRIGRRPGREQGRQGRRQAGGRAGSGPRPQRGGAAAGAVRPAVLKRRSPGPAARGRDGERGEPPCCKPRKDESKYLHSARQPAVGRRGAAWDDFFPPL